MNIAAFHDVAQKLAVFSLSYRRWCWSVTFVREAMMMLVPDYVFCVLCSVNNAAVYCACVRGRTDLTKMGDRLFRLSAPARRTHGT